MFGAAVASPVIGGVGMFVAAVAFPVVGGIGMFGAAIASPVVGGVGMFGAAVASPVVGGIGMFDAAVIGVFDTQPRYATLHLEILFVCSRLSHAPANRPPFSFGFLDF